MTLEHLKTNGAATARAMLACALASLAAGAAGCDDGGAAKAPIMAAPASGLAVVGSDFMSTVVSIVGADGTLAKDDCINSGTKGGKLTMTLSGDVTLPSQPQLGGELWLIDRGNASVTILTPTTCEARAQFSVSSGFASNPHDVSVVSEGKVYVTRYDKNATPTAGDDMTKGEDVLILDPRSGGILGRIDLAGEATAVDGKAIQARPDRMAIANGKVYVTLGNQDAKFAAAADGRVVIIDPETDTVAGRIDLPGLKNCSAMHVLAATKTLLVACGGSFADPDQAGGSGVVAIDLAVSPPVVTSTTKADKLDGKAVNFAWVAATSATRVFASTNGNGFAMPPTKDAAFVFDPATGTSVPLGFETGAFDMGRGSVGEGKLFVPDATPTKPRIHVFDVPATGDVVEASAFDPDPAKGMPPREIAWY